jgi:hypothetical protein
VKVIVKNIETYYGLIMAIQESLSKYRKGRSLPFWEPMAQEDNDPEDHYGTPGRPTG